MTRCVGPGWAPLSVKGLLCTCVLLPLQSWAFAAAQQVTQAPQGIQYVKATGGLVQRISRRLAAERSWRRLQQANTALGSVGTTAAASSTKPTRPPVPLTAAGVPARIFHLEVPSNQTGKHHSVLEAASLQPYTPIAGQTFVGSAANTPGNQSAAINVPQPAAAAAAVPTNQWYNNQVSGVSFFGRIPGTSSNQSLDGLYQLGADLPGPTTSNGCPDYPYPAGRVQYPTVFFTAALQDYGSLDILGTDEEAAFSAAVNAFLAPTLGDVASNTSWLHQGHNGPVLCLPSATALLEGGDALRDFFQTTLDKDPNMVFPTAAWGQIRTSNIIYRAPEVASELSFNWFASDYGNCSVLCGGGIQTRQVACMDSLSNPAAGSSCPQPAPATTRACQTQPCAVSTPTDFTLVFGAWNDCNSTCGTGSRTRGASCVSSEGYVGSLLDCDTTLQAVAAQTWQSCDLPLCPKHIWSYSAWICDNPDGCGGGTANRNATCVQADTQKPVNDTFCDLTQLDNSTQACAQAPCAVYYWRARELADCMPEDPQKPCGRYVQRRRFDCVNMTSNEVVPFISCTGALPDLGDVECPATITCIPDANGNYIPDVDSIPAGQLPSSVSPGDVLDSQTADDSSAGQQQVTGDTGTSVDAGPTGSTGMQDTSTGVGGGVAKPPGASGDGSGALPTFQVSEGGAGAGATTDNSSGSIGSTAAQPLQSTPTAAGNGTSTLAVSNGTNSSGNTASSSAAGGTSGGTILSDPSNVSTGSATTADAGNASGGNGATVPAGQAVSNDPVLQLGPGQVVPGWLFDNPTPNLQSVLRCPPGHAVTPDGACCSANNLDMKGNCCDSAVDACGVCNGTGKAIDALGACCSTLLDARGVCCDGSIDECGVCNGQNACLLRAELQASLPTAAVYLMPQSKIKQGLIDTLQSKMAGAIAAAAGRSFDKSRLTITLSAYKPVLVPTAAASATVVGPKANRAGNQPAGQNTNSGGNQYPQQSDADSSKFSTSTTLLGGPAHTAAPSRQAVAGLASNAVAAAAQPIFASVVRQDGSTAVVADNGAGDLGQHLPAQPQQADTMPAGSTQEPAQQASMPSALVAYKSPAAASGWFTDTAAARNVARILGTSMSGLRRLLGAAGTVAGPMPTGSSTIIQADASEPVANSGNTIMITALVQTGPQDSGLNAGTFMLALYQMVDAQFKIPGTGDTMEVNFIKSAERPSVCGDGICQAGERQAVDNPNSCPQDCGLPFLPCPPYNSSVPACNDRGVCYHSVGSCSCGSGYAGEDCSMCASNYKLVNGFCVASAFIAPPRANSVVCVDGICDQAQTIFSSGSERPNFRKQGYSSIGGIIGIAVATGASVLCVLVGAAIIAKRRRVYLVDKCRDKLAHEAQTAQG